MSAGVTGPANRHRGAGQGLQLEHRLARNGQRLAAGGQDVQAWRVREQPFGEPCDAVDEVLRVVEQEQQLLVGDERRDRREGRDARDLWCAERARDLGRDLRGVAERRQLGEPHAVLVAVDEPAGSLQHQPGLARPARADERHEPVTLDERRYLGELLLSSDEARQLDRQVGSARAQRAERREVSIEVADDDLVDLLGTVDVAKPVRAEVHELDRRREPIAGEHGGDRGADDLAAVGDGEDPRHPIEGGTEEVPVACLGGTRVERHPDPQRAGLVPGRIAQRTLGGDRRVDGSHGVGEDRQHPVAGRLDHAAAMPVDARAEEPIMLGERRPHPVGVLFPEARTALDVREQEGRDRAQRRRPGRPAPPRTRRPSRSRAGTKGWAASGNATAARCSQRTGADVALAARLPITGRHP